MAQIQGFLKLTQTQFEILFVVEIDRRQSAGNGQAQSAGRQDGNQRALNFQLAGILARKAFEQASHLSVAQIMRAANRDQLAFLRQVSRQPSLQLTAGRRFGRIVHNANAFAA